MATPAHDALFGNDKPIERFIPNGASVGYLIRTVLGFNLDDARTEFKGQTGTPCGEIFGFSTAVPKQFKRCRD
jgi:hypothetical protein